MAQAPEPRKTDDVADESAVSSRNIGSKTLARGLRALELVATTVDGLTVQELAMTLHIHRTIAYRVLATLEDFRLVAKDAEGRYRAGSGLSALAHHVQHGLRDKVEPHLRSLARELQATVALIVVEGREAVAVSVIEPPDSSYHLSFRAGSRHPLDRGSAGRALTAAMPASPDDPDEVKQTRERGYARTHGEVEPGAYGLAFPLKYVPGLPAACINLITYREDLIERALPIMAAEVAVINAELH
ncbi:IclR family transcriptional regulator [Nocardioides pelophilus]|uniref:IclR family transcriptional regulator n=1 Tax=Nocardioides pelophilus TaxID=2172019 RepID=UPI00160068BB|nr:helix-turn-helix domain-containing protein [Nocardioides pelophilus]